FSIFFYSPAPHRYLHSFPIRRSSDLLRQLIKREICVTLPTVFLIHQRHDARKARRGGGCTAKTKEMENLAFGTGRRRNGVRFARSEEHTSELQSLRHLVCRLLLEKKK